MIKMHKILFALCALHISLCAQESAAQKTSTIFLNGIVDSCQQVERYKDADAIITSATMAPFADLQTPQGYNFNTVLYHVCNFFGKPVNRNAMFMGQEGDIKVAQEVCNQKADPYILYGLSRGGAVAVSAAALNTLELQALIIESAPYDVSRPTYVAKCYLGIPFDHKQAFSYIFPAYDPYQEINAQVIPNIENKDIPIFIIHSKTDLRVDLSESLRYYAHFKHENFKNVYFVELPEGKHGHAITNPKMAPLYLQALHSFYKAHNLPYLKEHAQLDALQLKEQFQPHIANIVEEIKKDDTQLVAIYEQAKTRNIVGLAALAAAGLYYFRT